MRHRLAPTLGVLLVALAGGAGCAELVGADFDDLRPRPRGSGSDAAGASDAEEEAGNGDASIRSPGKPDATSDGRVIGGDDARGADGVSWSDVIDIRNGFDSRDLVDARHQPDGADIEGDGWVKDGDADDRGDARDGGNLDDAGDAIGDRRADDIDVGDVIDAEPPPDAPRTTGVIGGFVTLGPPNRGSSTIELRGHIISNAAVRGVTATGISVEGKIQ